MFLQCAALLSLLSVVRTDLREAYSWRQIDYLFPTEQIKTQAIESGQYIAENNVPVGLEVWEDRVFVTVPRWKDGVAASLTYFNLNETRNAPFLIPYPDWESHSLSSSEFGNLSTRIVSPFRIRADRCDRLWVLDTGIADILGNTTVYYPTTLIVFDLKRNKFLRRFQYPKDQVKDTSFFANIAVDEGTGCGNAFAYTADLGAFGMVVYSWKKNKSWRVTHNYFLSNPMEGEFNVHDNKFQWTDGLFGIALSKANRVDGHRTLYFHPFASTSEFQVSTEILQNETRAANSFHEYHVLGSRGPNTQSCASFMEEETGIIFYTQVNTDSITCWNSRTRPHYNTHTIGLVDRNNVTLVFPNDIKVDRKQNVWVLSDKLPMFLFGKLDPNQVNFRILTATVEEATNGTVCSPHYMGPDPEDSSDLTNRFGDSNLPICRNAGSSSFTTTPLSVAVATVFNLAIVLLLSNSKLITI